MLAAVLDHDGQQQSATQTRNQALADADHLALPHTLRAAELAGLDPARILADAIAERDLAGSRDIPAVIDARLRATASAPWSRCRPGRGPPRSPPSPTPDAAPTWRRSRR